MRKSLGSKRKQLGDADIATVTHLFGTVTAAQLARSFDASGTFGGSVWSGHTAGILPDAGGSSQNLKADIYATIVQPTAREAL